MSMLFRLWSYLKSTFSKPVNDYGSGEPFVPNVGMIVPHTQGAAGARSFDGHYSEYYYGGILARMIGLPFALRDHNGVYGAARSLKGEGCNFSIEPHANAFNGKAHGAEILVMKGDDLSAKYARLFIEQFSDTYSDRRIRHGDGIKWVGKGDRGYRNLHSAKLGGMKVAILTELFFIDNPIDFINPSDMADFWKDALCTENGNLYQDTKGST